MTMETSKHPLAFVKEALEQSTPLDPQGFSPVSDAYVLHEIEPSPHYEKMGVLILAGGQGTRLGFDGPKGCFELPLADKKSLFQLHFETIKTKGANGSVAIMTSPLNHEATKAYLEKHNWFGLHPDQVDLFEQELIPMCDDQGNLFLDAPDHIAESPAGNGKALFHLHNSSIWAKWRERGIEYIQVVPVDNPLAKPFDGELLACHETSHAELVLKCIERVNPEEKLGVIVVKDGQLMIREYSEVSTEVKTGQLPDGRLRYYLGNSGLFSCSMDFVERMAEADFSMPWHLAHKQGECLVETPEGWTTEKVWIWKFETFIFDLFPSAHSYQIIVGDRKQCFAPLKNLTGPDSPETVAEAVNSSVFAKNE